jgi:hypothetical protein
MSDNVKVELSKEFLARIAAGTQGVGSTSDIEPINLDFDRNSSLPADAVANYAFVYAEPGASDKE